MKFWENFKITINPVKLGNFYNMCGKLENGGLQIKINKYGKIPEIWGYKVTNIWEIIGINLEIPNINPNFGTKILKIWGRIFHKNSHYFLPYFL